MEISIIAENTGGVLNPVTAQIISAAKMFEGDITVVCPGGFGAEEVAKISGVGKVVSVEGDCFSDFDGLAWCQAIESVVTGEILLSSSSNFGREIISILAAIREIPAIQDITELTKEMVFTRPVLSGKAIEKLKISGPCAFTIRANIFPAAESGGNADISIINKSSEVGISVKEAISKANEKLDVSEAEIIISGGRGMGSPENFAHLYEISEVVGAAVGASRAAVDTWEEIPHSMQVGQTGKTVTPKLYVAVGISGAIQHLAGMRTSKYIVAINKDSEAPIFGVADYGIVANWEDALPILKDELEKLALD